GGRPGGASRVRGGLCDRGRKGEPKKGCLLATGVSPPAEKATQTAIELAQLLEAELLVVTVWSIPYTTVGLAPAPPLEGLAQLGEHDARKIVAAAAAQAEDAGVEARTLVLRGFPVEELCLAAERFQPRFLVIGSARWGLLNAADL